MSVLTPITTITRPEDAVEFIADYLKSSQIPLEYVAKYDEPLLPKYPSALVMAGAYSKELHGTHTWLLTLRAEIYIMHARMTESRQFRSYNDLSLATQVVNYLERDLSLGRRVIASWIESETPNVMPRPKGAVIVGTRLGWAGTTEARF